MECMPDIYGNYIVWEDRNNGTLAADIVLYNIANKEKKYITKDDYHQGNPKIFENFVVWMDERNGISTNDIFIDGKAPNSDIFIYDIEKGTERNLTEKDLRYCLPFPLNGLYMYYQDKLVRELRLWSI